MNQGIKELLSKTIFVTIDILIILASILLAYYLRGEFNFLQEHDIPLNRYITFYPLFIVIILIFTYEGIYTYRFDFWHETKLILKALILSSILIFAYLAMTKSVENYSRLTIGLTILIVAILAPLGKLFIKKLLYKLKIWRKKAKVYGEDSFLTDEIYSNPYLGYCHPKSCKNYSTIFINSKQSTIEELKNTIEKQLMSKKEVIFTPLLNDYDLTHSQIYELSNRRTNLIVYKNRLKSWHLRFLQSIFNYFLVLLLLPILLPVIIIISIAIRAESKGSPFFVHNRIGKDGKVIPVIKFRSMYCDAKERLEKLLAQDKKIKDEWENNFKIKNDPRVTKVGKILRKTSLDELPQIINVLLGQMNFVGPRPVVKDEIDNFYKSEAEYYYMVKPGITGLWQVSGRSDTDYDFRIKLDKWYVLNWSVWLDIIILFKTVKVVLKRDGAY